MTRQNVDLSETVAGEDKNESLSLFTLWRENSYLHILGHIVHDSHENDNFQEQHHNCTGEGLGDTTW